MRFTLDPELAQFESQVRDHLRSAMTPELVEQIHTTGVFHDYEFTRGLAEKGWYAADPAQGERMSPFQTQILIAELHRADAPMYLGETTRMVASVVRQVGTPFVQERVLDGAANGDVTIALGFSEPECGSDVAAASTRAVRDGDDWLINGSKMFTTNGHIADYVFLLARTDPEQPKHKGLTMFLVPTNSEGFDAQAVWTLSGERTNITFYSDLRISDQWRIGEVNAGWQTLLLALEDEHASGWGPHIARLLEHAERWAADTKDASGIARIDDPDVRRRLARAAIEVEVSSLLLSRCAWLEETGQRIEAEGPMSKLFSTEALERASQDFNEMVGPDALRSPFDPTAPENGQIQQIMRFSLGTTIYAGTSEVQRTIIAQRGLGLPR
ncbi:acyl-CoA dehydrogenase family protein [Mycolicibacterium vinylchloridicum]|uniref:acyl-CoA dehydrogenase family protein n=1 Tax=Mycolicibacterium vinylchloridicum TaxID=2736928 RepID=UPI0015CB15F7|nr:acyl-CoA dehydrogenase family protein [Mycolicibacterium vinylchloridicum]